MKKMIIIMAAAIIGICLCLGFSQQIVSASPKYDSALSEPPVTVSRIDNVKYPWEKDPAGQKKFVSVRSWKIQSQNNDIGQITVKITHDGAENDTVLKKELTINKKSASLTVCLDEYELFSKLDSGAYKLYLYVSLKGVNDEYPFVDKFTVTDK